MILGKFQASEGGIQDSICLSQLMDMFLSQRKMVFGTEIVAGSTYTL